MAERKQNVSFLRHLSALWCMMETFCFGRIHYGWASMVYVLKREGFFGNKCETLNETLSTQSVQKECDYQDKQLSLLYSVANGLSVIPIFLCGTSLSRFGPVKTRIVYSILFITGCVFMIASNSDIPWFACAGIMLLAGSGRVFLLTNIQISKTYKTGSFIVIAVISGCFDSSSAITLFIKLAYEAGVGMKVSFAVILCLSFTTMLNTYITFNRVIPRQSLAGGGTCNYDGDGQGVTLRSIYRSSVFSYMYISHFMWFTLVAIHFMFFITSSNIYIQGIVQAIPDTGNLYVRNMKTAVVGFLITNFLSISMAISSIFHIKLLVYLVFCILAILRALLFAMAYSFLTKSFPNAAFGVLSALIDVQACLIMLIQRAFIQWKKAYDEAAFHIRIFIIASSTLATIHPIYVYLKARKDENADKGQSFRCSEVLQKEHLDNKPSSI